MVRRGMWAVTVAAMCATFLTVAGPATAATSGNLIVNGDAESSGRCSSTGLDAMTLPGWAVTAGSPDVVCYGAPGGYPTASDPGPADRATGFFDGGGTGNAVATQTVDVSSAATAIDGGGITYNLGGWLGGFSSQNDRAGLSAAFRDAGGTTLATATIAAVTNTDRGNATKLLQRAATGTVPPGTRSVLVTMTFTWTAGGSTDGYVDDVSLTLSTPVTAPVLTVPASNVPAFDHVFVVYMENENFSADEAPAGNYIVGNPAAPYINNTLAPMGTLLSGLYATTHPSDPNYLALAGGTTFDLSTNPPVGSVDASHLGDSVESVGKTWKAYSEGMNGNCDKTNHGEYFFDDQPFMIFANVANNAARCAAHVQPDSQFRADLASAATTPNFVWFAADDFDDMEAGGIGAGDTWLSGELPHIFASPAWTTQRSLLVVTWDEGYAKSFGPSYPNRVPAYVVASSGLGRPGATVATRYTQFSLGSTVAHALGLPFLTANDRYAQPLRDVWAGTGGTPFAVPVVNPGAESGACSTTGGSGANATGWALTGAPQQVCYGSPGGYPAAAQGAVSPGNAFFDGGASATASMAQTCDVSAKAAAIDAGTMPYTLSAWLGGYSNQNDRAGLTATFLSASGATLGSATLGPVTNTMRGNATGLLKQTATGTVPAGTRSVRFTVAYTRGGGTEDDGYVDDIAMALG